MATNEITMMWADKDMVEVEGKKYAYIFEKDPVSDVVFITLLLPGGDMIRLSELKTLLRKNKKSLNLIKLPRVIRDAIGNTHTYSRIC